MRDPGKTSEKGPPASSKAASTTKPKLVVRTGPRVMPGTTHGAFTKRFGKFVVVEGEPERVVKEVREGRQGFGSLLESVACNKGVDLGAEAGPVSEILEQFAPTRVAEIGRKARANERDQPIELLQEQFKVLGVVTDVAQNISPSSCVVILIARATLAARGKSREVGVQH